VIERGVVRKKAEKRYVSCIPHHQRLVFSRLKTNIRKVGKMARELMETKPLETLEGKGTHEFLYLGNFLSKQIRRRKGKRKGKNKWQKKGKKGV